jgi:hypothetical protein
MAEPGQSAYRKIAGTLLVCLLLFGVLQLAGLVRV